jgi:hypothetical protein
VSTKKSPLEKTPLGYFCKKHLDLLKTEFFPDFARDQKILQELSESLGQDGLKKAICNYLKTNDEYVKNAGYAIPLFRKQINQYTVKSKKEYIL